MGDLVLLITLTPKYVQTHRKRVLLNGVHYYKLAIPLEESRQLHSGGE